jgi:S1-C subfamily serine protease
MKKRETMGSQAGRSVALAVSALLASIGCEAPSGSRLVAPASVAVQAESVGAAATSVCRVIVGGDGGGGTGFAIRSEGRGDDVFVVTAFHVVADADHVTAIFPSKVGAPW